jgi:arylsulfatase/uncharacterized sulfatase
MSGPGIERQGTMTDEFVFVTDLAPTILGLLDIDEHNGDWRGREVEPIVGADFSAFLASNSATVHDSAEAIGYELGGNSALFKGDHKIVINRTQRESEWGLYNITIDPGETNNLTLERPELLNEMIADYQNYVEANEVLPLPEGYNRTGRILGEALRELRRQ